MADAPRGRGRPRGKGQTTPKSKKTSKKDLLAESARVVTETPTKSPRIRKQTEKYSPQFYSTPRSTPRSRAKRKQHSRGRNEDSDYSSSGEEVENSRKRTKNLTSPGPTRTKKVKFRKRIIEEEFVSSDTGSSDDEEEEVPRLLNNANKRRLAKDAKKNNSKAQKDETEDSPEEDPVPSGSKGVPGASKRRKKAAPKTQRDQDVTLDSQEEDLEASGSKGVPAAGSSKIRRKESHNDTRSQSQSPEKSPGKKCVPRRKRGPVTYGMDTMNELVAYIESYPLLWDSNEDKINSEAVEECWKRTLQLPTLKDKPDETGE